MKPFRILTFSVVFCMYISGLYALGSTIPKWSEFCPPQYLNPRLLTDEEIDLLSEKQGIMKTKEFFGCKSNDDRIKKIRNISLLYADECSLFKKYFTKQAKNTFIYENMEKQYWIDRRTEFYKKINQCKKLSKKKQNSCYSELRHQEEQIKENEQLNLKYTELYNSVPVKDTKQLNKRIDIKNLPKYDK